MAIERWELLMSTHPDSFLLKIRGPKTDVDEIVRQHPKICQDVHEIHEDLFQWTIFVVDASLSDRLSLQNTVMTLAEEFSKNQPSDELSDVLEKLTGVLENMDLVSQPPEKPAVVPPIVRSDPTTDQEHPIPKHTPETPPNQGNKSPLPKINIPLETKKPIFQAPPLPATGEGKKQPLVRPVNMPSLNLFLKPKTSNLSSPPETTTNSKPTAPPPPIKMDLVKGLTRFEATDPSPTPPPQETPKQTPPKEVFKWQTPVKKEEAPPPLIEQETGPARMIMTPFGPSLETDKTDSPMTVKINEEPRETTPTPPPAVEEVGTKTPPVVYNEERASSPPVSPVRELPENPSAELSPNGEEKVSFCIFYSEGTDDIKNRFCHLLQETAHRVLGRSKKITILKEITTAFTPETAMDWVWNSRTLQADGFFVIHPKDLTGDFLRDLPMDAEAAGLLCLLVSETDAQSPLKLIEILTQLTLVKRRKRLKPHAQ